MRQKQKLRKKAVSQKYEDKLWTKVVSKMCVQKLQATVWNKPFETNVNKIYNQKLQVKVMIKSCEQKKWKQSVKKICE